jgi:polyisoprenoid-binding protein YceI
MPLNQVATTEPLAGLHAWTIDPTHSSAEFAVRHLMITTVKGRFKEVRGTVHLDEADPERSRVEAEVDVASIDTGLEPRDAHLRSADFFDAANHPLLKFRSKHVVRADAQSAVVVGDLTIRGITREVPLTVEHVGTISDPWGGRRAGFAAEATINRKDFGLNWNQVLEAGGVVVGDKIRITLNVEVIQQPAA